jgi:hypothetical protein
MAFRAIIINPTIRKGEAKDINIELFTDEGLPLNLSEYIDPAVFLMAKRWATQDDADALINEECDIIDEENGYCKAFLPWEETTNYDEGRYLAEIDLVFYDSNGYEHREKSDTLIMWIKSPIRVN